jgi:hypothetical protein
MWPKSQAGIGETDHCCRDGDVVLEIECGTNAALMWVAVTADGIMLHYILTGAFPGTCPVCARGARDPASGTRYCILNLQFPTVIT